MGRFIPRGIEPHGGCGKAVWPVLLACALLVAAPVRLFAQMSDGLRTYYVPSRSFKIPFNFRGMENDPRIEVLLNVSPDGQQYRQVATARPQDQRFFYSAPSDGCYYFIVQTRDASGALTPADLRNAAERIRIYVDSQDPIIEALESVPSRETSLPTIHWTIQETNLKEIWADYRSISGSEWVPLFLPVEKDGQHTWKPSWGGELEVRMQAVDKAGRRSEIRTLRLRVADNVTRMPPPAEPAGAGKVMHVKSKTFQLDYTLDDQTIGPSQVASVDIWKIHAGQGWKKCPEKGQARGPASVTVETTGRWGFRLIPRSGAGLAERDPQPGDTPDIWVEVDDRQPQVKITNVTVTKEPDGDYLTVYWKADDAFLRSMPISILMAGSLQAPAAEWKELPNASGLPNTGSWRQKIKDLNLGDRYEFALKVTAIDEAGNLGSDQWSTLVKVDLMIPRIKHIEVKPGAAAGGGGHDAYSGQRTPPFGGQLSSSLPQSPLAPPSGQLQLSNPSLPSTTNGTGGGFATPDKR
jgi:hypothetical protein